MKKILIVLTLAIFYTSCKAQTPVLNRFERVMERTENAYYKDIDSIFNPFEGTWVATNQNKTFKVTFVKKEMVLEESYVNYYEDLLIGEFEYYEKGVLKTSTLFYLDNPPADLYRYSSFYSLGAIDKYRYEECLDCAANDWRLLMRFTEPANDDPCLEGGFAMRIVMENGAEKLKAQFFMKETACGYKDDGTPSTARYFSVPFGNYTFVKE